MSQPSGMGTAGIVAVPIPDDGATGTVLLKETAADYDMEWSTDTVVFQSQLDALQAQLECSIYFLGE